MRWAHRCASGMRAWCSLGIRARRSWALRMQVRCGVRTTTCRRMIFEGSRSVVESAAAAVFVAARLRARATREEIRRCRACKWADSGALARKYLGAGVEQRLPADGFAETGTELRPDEDFAGPANGCARDGALRRR